MAFTIGNPPANTVIPGQDPYVLDDTILPIFNYDKDFAVVRDVSTEFVVTSLKAERGYPFNIRWSYLHIPDVYKGRSDIGANMRLPITTGTSILVEVTWDVPISESAGVPLYVAPMKSVMILPVPNHSSVTTELVESMVAYNISALFSGITNPRIRLGLERLTRRVLRPDAL